MMRDLKISDLVELEKHAQFPLNFLLGKPRIFEKTFEDEEGIIGSIFVTATAEISAVFNYNRPKGIVRVMQQLPKILQGEMIPKGYRDLHAFITDPKFADILIKHSGFEPVVGQVLVRGA